MLSASRSDVSDMNQNSPDSPVNSTATIIHEPVRQPLGTPQRAFPTARALAAALAGIRADAQRESETYLRDTVVPHGGE